MKPNQADAHDGVDVADLFDRYADRVHAYARRHVDAHQVDDVVSETFLTAWRRRDDLPDEPLGWLIVTARHVIANQRRTGRRADQLWSVAVREQWRTPDGPDPEAAAVERDRWLAALESCTRPEREAIMLTAWDGLDNAEAAAVAECSPRAFTVRLSRARARLQAAFDEADQPERQAAPAPKLPRPVAQVTR